MPTPSYIYVAAMQGAQAIPLATHYLRWKTTYSAVVQLYPSTPSCKREDLDVGII